MNIDFQRPPIRIALVGIGRAMMNDHYPVFRQHPTLFRVVAACEPERDRREFILNDFPDCRMYRQIGDMLDERGIDLVDIATPSALHVEHALESLRRGYWTLLEPPMSITYDDAQVLRGAAKRAKDRLLVLQRGMFSPDYLLAKQEMSDERLGTIHSIVIRREDYVRRDDWQTVKRLGGGAAYYAMTDLLIQAMRLLPSPPVQMWSELKRLASLGDAEDFAHINLKTRDMLSADVEYNGGAIEQDRSPSFAIRGTRGVFKVAPGAVVGHLSVIDPDYAMPRRRSSVRTPDLADLHEELPIREYDITLPADTPFGPSAFWRHVYETVRTAAPFPIKLEESIEAIKFAHLMKKTSPFGK